MKVISLSKAKPIGNRHHEAVQIFIQNDTPDFKDLKQGEAYYEEQAATLADGLFDSLPQGTYDRLVIKLMTKKTSLYAGRTAS